MRGTISQFTSLILLVANAVPAVSLAITPANVLPTGEPLTPAQKLRSLITQSYDRTILLPGVHDALSAKIFQQSGAECLFLSGFGVAASYLGEPDAGILTLDEMEKTAKRVIDAAPGIPVIVDGDTGYGGSSNIRRAIRGLAKAGAAAVCIDDQVRYYMFYGSGLNNICHGFCTVRSIKSVTVLTSTALNQLNTMILRFSPKSVPTVRVKGVPQYFLFRLRLREFEQR